MKSKTEKKNDDQKLLHLMRGTLGRDITISPVRASRGPRHRAWSVAFLVN
jgi:hypothetical protein